MKILILARNSLFLMAFGAFVACQNAEKQPGSRVEKLPFFNSPEFTPHWLDDPDSLRDFHRISPFRLVNQDGDTVTEKTIEGKICVADFFFTSCPGICPKMTKNMAVLQDAFLHDDNVLLLSHSVTPDQDSVPVLKNYAKGKGIRSKKWHLLTGERSQIYRLGRKDYFVEEDLGLEKEAEDFLHTENFVLIDQNRHIRGIYNGLNAASVRQLVADVRALEAEQEGQAAVHGN